MTNIEKLTARLNACKNRRRIYNALMALSAEPNIQQIEDATEERDVLIGEVVDLVAVAEVN